VKHGVPLVSGAAIGWDAQISVYDTRQADAPCYACLFPPDATYEDVACATMGVFAPLVGIVGSVQAAEALKLLARHRPAPDWPAADAGCTQHGLGPHRGAARAALPRVRLAPSHLNPRRHVLDAVSTPPPRHNHTLSCTHDAHQP
jgi:molybdopterin/thiamine biosynthesis adenylyltransferase